MKCLCINKIGEIDELEKKEQKILRKMLGLVKIEENKNGG